MKNIYLILPIISLIGLTGCDLAKNYTKIDREGDLEVQDYRDVFAPREAEVPNTDSDTIPDFMPYIADVSDNMKAMPLVSVNLNQSVPLRDALYELAKEAEYDLELDPNIRGAIIFTARNKPFDVVVRRIADVAGLRYKFEEETLRIELDSPYSETYKVDFLNIVRNSSSSISNNVSVVSGEGADTGSNFSASTSSSSDFWAELETNLSQILNVSGAYSGLRTSNDPRLNVTDPTPVPVQQVGEDDSENLNANTSANTQDTESGPPQAVLEVGSLPLDETFEEDAAATQEAISFSLNRQAGMVLVFAPQKQHEQVKKYLELVRKVVTSQVLIEAKVLEVSLTDEFSAGIAWNDINLLGDGFLQFDPGITTNALTGVTAFGTTRPSLDPVTSPLTNLNIGVFGNDFSGLAQVVSRFGTVKALASPRLTVLNNQPAVLNVATNVVYFELDIDRTEGTDGTGDTVEIDSEIKSVPEGILINVLPSIDLETGRISMSVRPTVTTITDFVDDPGIAFLTGDSGLSSPVPQVNVQEIDSIISMHSGEAVVMGGLMQDRVQSTQNGVPGLSELPFAGALFRNQGDKIQKTELVIFLKATILDGQSGIHDTDRDFYKMFSGDRRPFRM